ncbi:MAG: selenium cofactor biosynthesis protein YqeC [Arenicellales bacterium]|nr:selenium cofactor biosynthesis protein YqeC [Arenicellales bacterium]
MTRNILDIFSAHEGIISFVGAGGKKSTIYRLVSEHSGKIAITSTVRTPPFRRRLSACQVVAEPDELYTRLKSATRQYKRVAYAYTSDKPARLRGVPPEEVSNIHSEFGFDATFIKADGARLRWLKAPGQDEPLVPHDNTILVPIISIRAIGKPLSDEVAHRAKDAARVMGISLGSRITAAHLARLLASDQGGLKKAGTAMVIPVVNMVENKEDMRLARLIAEQALDQSTKILRVVIASMVREDPILQVVQD